MALVVALALLAPASVSGQEAVWTMDSCMQYAVTHASDVQRQRIVTRQNEQNYRRAIADFLPSVGASVGAQYQWGRNVCLLYTSASPRDYAASRMPSSA